MEETAPKASLGQYIGLWGYKLFNLILRLCDVRLVALVGRVIGYLIWATMPSRRQIVARNFRIVIDPMLRADKLNPLVRRNIVRTSMNLACALKTGLMTEKEMERSIRIEGAEPFTKAGLEGTAICCVPHAGNWEILSRIRPKFMEVEHFGCMYRRLSNPLLEKLVYASRTAYGCEMFSKEDGLRSVLKLARTGGQLGVLSDQFTQEGIFIPYFGKVTGVTPLPALLYKRCKGKGTLFSVFTRNTGLGKWDAVLGRTIHLEEPCDTMAQITMQINKALESCQNENIIDGFWMHHRWKSTNNFAPPQEDEVTEVALNNMRLPFRIIVCMPESMEEALYLLPMLRALKQSRVDAQLTIAAPEAQLPFWQAQPEVTYTVSTDGTVPLFTQLEADELYKDGPFDYLFMFSENRRAWKELNKLAPIYISGFAENRFSKGFRTRLENIHTGEPRHSAMDYLMLLRKRHALHAALEKAETYMLPRPGNAEAQGDFICPFSTLGEADSWPEENWKQLVQALPNGATLLALQQDKEQAEAMAARLGIPSVCVRPEEVEQKLGENTRLFAVDGLLPQLAGACSATCRVIMASRLAARYYTEGERTRCFTNHVPCHPCYRTDCDAAPPCAQGVTPAQLLA